MAIDSLSASTVQPARSGLTLVAVKEFGGVPSVSLDGCFTSSYENYHVRFDVIPNTLNAHVEFRYRTAGVDNSAADYFYSLDGLQGDGTRRTSNGNGATNGRIAQTVLNNQRVAGSFDVENPLATQYKGIQGQSSYEYSNLGSHVLQNFFISHRGVSLFDGFTLYPSSGTFTGKVYVYGYAKAVEQFGPIIPVVTGLEKVVSQSFVAAASVPINNCFTSLYTNYHVIVANTASTADALLGFRLRAAGVDDASSNYYSVQHYATWAAAAAQQGGANPATSAGVAYGSASLMLVLDVRCPSLPLHTTWVGNFGHDNYHARTGGRHSVTTAYDGFSLTPASGTITGNVTVYGYRD